VRVNQVLAQIPVKTANNTPVGDLILDPTADAPQEPTPETAALVEESEGAPQGALQPPPAFVMSPDTLVRPEDLTTSAAFSAISRSMIWSAAMLSSLIGMIFVVE
jgi:hypothetical protein